MSKKKIPQITLTKAWEIIINNKGMGKNMNNNKIKKTWVKIWIIINKKDMSINNNTKNFLVKKIS